MINKPALSGYIFLEDKIKPKRDYGSYSLIGMIVDIGYRTSILGLIWSPGSSGFL